VSKPIAATRYGFFNCLVSPHYIIHLGGCAAFAHIAVGFSQRFAVLKLLSALAELWAKAQDLVDEPTVS